MGGSALHAYASNVRREPDNGSGAGRDGACDKLVYMRDRTKDQAETIRTHHTRYDKLLDQYWEQNAERVALKQDMHVMKENVMNATAMIKHLRAAIAITFRNWRPKSRLRT